MNIRHKETSLIIEQQTLYFTYKQVLLVAYSWKTSEFEHIPCKFNLILRVL